MAASAILQRMALNARPSLPLRRRLGTKATGTLPVRCLGCGLKDAFLPCDLALPDLVSAGEPVITRRRILRGEHLYRSGDAFRSLFTVRSGSFKAVKSLADGRGQVIGVHMAGELLGMDGIADGLHACDAVALEDSDVCGILYSLLEFLVPGSQRLQRQVHRAMSRQIVREHGLMLVLGTMSADERLSTFLLDLSRRFAERGYSPSEFVLRMTREEIGSYLGLKLETVSRCFSRFRDEGWISVDMRRVRIRDVAALARCAAGSAG
jgi:CRP/FNR family transcriptional regulator